MHPSRDLVTVANSSRLRRVRRLETHVSCLTTRGQHLSFDQRGTLLVSKDHLGSRVRWWDLNAESSEPRCTLVDMKLDGVLGLLPEGDGVVVSGIPGTGVPMPWRRGLLALSVRDGAIQRHAPLDESLSSLGISGDGAHMVLLGEARAQLWDAERWCFLRELEVPARDFYFKSCAFSPDGRLVAAALVGNYLADDVLGEVWLWDTATGALLYRQPLDMPFAWSVAFHPIEPLLVVGGNSNDLPVMDVRARRIVRTLRDVSAGASRVSFSPDGSLLVVSSDGPGFCVHRFDTDEQLFAHWDDNDEQTSDALLSPDGTWVAWGQGDMSVGLWTPERDSSPGDHGA